MKLYLCVMIKVCIADGVVQHRDDEAKSKWAGSAVELPFLRAIPELLETVNLRVD